jgi:hypothetical protein
VDCSSHSWLDSKYGMLASGAAAEAYVSDIVCPLISNKCFAATFGGLGWTGVQRFVGWLNTSTAVCGQVRLAGVVVQIWWGSQLVVEAVFARRR